MKISMKYEYKFKFGDPNLSVCGFVCWHMDNTEERMKNTAFPFKIFPGMTFMINLPKRKAIHYRCCQKVFDKNSPSDADYEANQNKFFSQAQACHSKMISDYNAVFGGFGINKDGFNFRSNANNNAQVQGLDQWSTSSDIDGFSQFLHLRER